MAGEGKAKTYFWLKLKKDFFKNLAMKKLRKIAGGDTYTIIYLKLMLLSLEDKGHLYFEGVESNFGEELALALDEDEENVKVTLAFLESVGLLTVEGNDQMVLNEVQLITGKETDKAELMRELRKKRREQKQLEENGNIVTTELPDVTKCYTEKEKELYKPELYKPELYKPDTDTNQLSNKKELNKKNQLIKNKHTSKTDGETIKKIVDLYNETCISLPKVQKISEPRKRKLKTRLKTYSVDDFETLFKKAEASSFLTGGGERGWKADFDWLIKEEHMVKVLEDSYIDRETKSKAAREQEEAFRMMAEWAEEDD